MQAFGDLFIISAPSGAGKTSLVKALVESLPDIGISISHTTREPRQNEQDGVDYHFVDKSSFDNMLAQDLFLEHATVFRHDYGTSRAWVEKQLKTGQDVVLEIDWQGAQQVRVLWPNTISVFILPPSLSALEARLKARGRDSEADIAHRLGIAQEELRHFSDFDYLICNEHFEQALEELIGLVRSVRLRQSRQAKRLHAILQSLLQP